MGAAAAVAAAMLREGMAGPVLFPCGEIRRDELPTRLRQEGIEVDEVVCYRSIVAGEEAAREAVRRAGILIVASPSVAELLARASAPTPRPSLLAVGPTTAAAARAAGWSPAAVAEHPDVDALVAEVRIAPRRALDPMNDLFLRACRREPVERPPVWMMRQAGRYLPEYRAVRARADFLTMVHTPELAARGDAAAGGHPRRGCGHHLQRHPRRARRRWAWRSRWRKAPDPGSTIRIGSPGDLERLRDVDVERDLGYVLEALRLTRAELRGRVPLIGFAGAPWTLMSYMVEGAGTKTFTRAKRFLVEQPSSAHALLGRLAATVGRFLEAQVAAGAQAVQLFDSWAAALGPRDFREFALPYLAEAVRAARNAGVPVIAFAPGAGWALEEIATATGADVIGVDWQTDAGRGAAQARGHAGGAAGQPGSHLAVRPALRDRARTHAMLEAFGGVGHIANLGHGILPDVPVEHAAAFVRRGAGVAAAVSARLRSRRCGEARSPRFTTTPHGSSASWTAGERYERIAGSGPAVAAASPGFWPTARCSRSAASIARWWRASCQPRWRQRLGRTRRRATSSSHSSWRGSASWPIRGIPRCRPCISTSAPSRSPAPTARESTPGSAGGPTSPRPTLTPKTRSTFIAP